MVFLPIVLPETHFARDHPQIRSHTEHLLDCLALLHIGTDLSELLILVLGDSDLTIDLRVFLVHVFHLVLPVLDALGGPPVWMYSLIVEEP